MYTEHGHKLRFPGNARHRRRDAASISEAILWTTVRDGRAVVLNGILQKHPAKSRILPEAMRLRTPENIFASAGL